LRQGTWRAKKPLELVPPDACVTMIGRICCTITKKIKSKSEKENLRIMVFSWFALKLLLCLVEDFAIISTSYLSVISFKLLEKDNI